MSRLPRFKRASTIAPIQLTERDHQIIRLLERHRFLRSHQIIALLGGSAQQISRRLQLLYHHGYLERPRAQLDYYHQSGNQHIIYGLGSKAGTLLKANPEIKNQPVSWNEKNSGVGRIFMEHALLVSDIMVALELACRKYGEVKLLYEDQLGLKRKPFQWWVKADDNTRLGVIPDQVLALQYTDQAGQNQRVYFFLEADRGTMPIIRKNLIQTSFYRKLLAYEATWTQKIHQRQLGIHRFRVLTVTTGEPRVKSLLDACSKLKRGHGLFLFTDQATFKNHPNLFEMVWQVGRSGETSTLLNDFNQRPTA